MEGMTLSGHLSNIDEMLPDENLCQNFVKIQFSQKSITGFQKLILFLVLINMYLSRKLHSRHN